MPPETFVTRYTEFVRCVSRYRSERLLPVLGAITSKQSLNTYRPNSGDELHPWIAAAIARESIAWSKMTKDRPVNDRALREMVLYYASLRDPFLDEHGTEEAVTSFMIRTAYEQFPHQHPLLEDTARVLPLLDPPEGHRPKRELEVVSAVAWEHELGTSIENFMRAGTLFSTGAWVNNGVFSPAWLDQANFSEIVERVPREETLQIFHEQFALDWASSRSAAREGRPVRDDLRKYDFNFLAAKPFVEIASGKFCAPQAAFVSRHISPASLYYVGCKAWGNPFTRDFGWLLEAYVGRQLRLLEGVGVTVHEEVEYEPEKKSCDYLIDVAGHVILVEVKAARVAMPGRIDFEGYWEDVERDVGKAFKQIARTQALLADQCSSFPQELHGKPTRGVVVTAEPHYLINSTPVRSRLQSPTCTTAVMSVGELEKLIEYALGHEANDVLVRVTNTDSSGFLDYDNQFRTIEREYARIQNPVLSEGWTRGQWQFPDQ